MRYCKHIIIVLLLGYSISCSNNKKDETVPSEKIDSSAAEGTGNAAAESTSTKKGSRPKSRSVDSGNNDRNAILANIDQYLVSKPDISNATLTVQNTLKDATIIKAYAEVTTVDAAGKSLRTDFLILEHIEPGESKSVRMPDVTNAVKATSNIIRLKSDELTNGETILVGSRYTPK